MYFQSSFLQKPNQKLRHFLQLQGFMSNTYLDIASSLLDKKPFIIPQIEVSFEDLNFFEIPKYLRLGNRLERFFSFIITQSQQFELLLENIQIVNNKITIGEIDFLIKDLYNDEIIHVELGGKLYLYDINAEDELSRWVGPNKTDSLINKIQKLKNFQFPLLENPYAIEFLKSKGLITTEIMQKICFKVRLFMPYALKEFIPKYVEAHNIKGYFLKKEEFLEFHRKNDLYFLPEKQDWIVNPMHCEVWFSYDEIQSLIVERLNAHQSPMVWLKKEEGIIETFFVVFWN